MSPVLVLQTALPLLHHPPIAPRLISVPVPLSAFIPPSLIFHQRLAFPFMSDKPSGAEHDRGEGEAETGFWWGGGWHGWSQAPGSGPASMADDESDKWAESGSCK